MKLYSHRNCFLITFCIVSFLFFAGMSSAATFTGFFEDNRPSKLYADIPLNLATESVVYLTYTDSCANPDNAKIELYNAWNFREMSVQVKYSTQPLGPLPLAAGHWTVKLRCERESYDPGNPVAYTLEQSIVAGSSYFAKGSEPDVTSEEALPLTSGKSFSGWLGYQGYTELYADPYNLHASDIWDDYYFSLTAGTKIRIKLEYDQTLVNALGDRDISVETYKRVGNNLYDYAHPDLSHWWQSSGDITDQFTITQDGIYLFRVGGGYGNVPKTNYGGYRISFIVNDEPVPDSGELSVIYQSAQWVMVLQDDLFQKPSYNLHVKFQVKNTYHAAKTVMNIVALYASLLHETEDDWAEETWICVGYMEVVIGRQCRSNNMDVSQFCPDAPTCVLSAYGDTSPPLYTLAPQSVVDQEVIIPITHAEYLNFSNTQQVILIGIKEEGREKNNDCFAQGMLFPSIPFTPAILNLLL